MKKKKSSYILLYTLLLFFTLLSIVTIRTFGFREVFTVLSVITSVVFTLQAAFTYIWLTYAWNDENGLDTIVESGNEKTIKPKSTFSIFIPGLHEEDVIYTTVTSIAKLNYPSEMFEVFVIHRDDDNITIAETKRAIKDLRKSGYKNVKLLIPDFHPRNKPDKLNYALSKAKYELVVIFDAEDEVHPELLNVANQHFQTHDTDILQAGVQLMNFTSRWFSALNCLEYYYWFRSALHLFSKHGITPLGGVTAFFRRELLNKVGGWDTGCLTEDCDIGFRMSLKGAKIRILYDAEIATRESTPLSIDAFIKQRTRWDLGFLQIIAKKDWMKLPSLKQKALALYILFTPLGQMAALLSIPVITFLGAALHIPIYASLLSLVPSFIMILIFVNQVILLYDFTQAYGFKYPFWMPLRILVTFPIYIIILSYAATRATFKYFSGDFRWEKTPHNNTHRDDTAPLEKNATLSTSS